MPFFSEIVTVHNLFCAFFRFRIGKRTRQDVADFTLHLGREIIQLYDDITTGQYRHGPYHHFVITDPKHRDIHKAFVRDRVVHHLLYYTLYPYFDKKFIYDSYSCRVNKGTLRALNRFSSFIQKCSQDYQKPVYILKCDIRKFFASIHHKTLFSILEKHIVDKDTIVIFKEIIQSFNTEGKQGVGLPLGNLTSQLLVNIYMNEFDQFVKHQLKQKYYIRYADDFVCMSQNKQELENLIVTLGKFLKDELFLELHPYKVFIKNIRNGVDFLGWIHFEHHKILRGVTKRRILNNNAKNPSRESYVSYQGHLQHGSAYRLSKKLVY